MNTGKILPIFDQNRELLYRQANLLALITIFYNLIEGIVSVTFGITDETIALFGFGVDSFVEVMSGIGIWHMIRRIRKNALEAPDRFEREALRITGTAFFILAAGLCVTAAINLISGHRPGTTLWGIIISIISIVTMWALIHYKLKIGKKLGSDAIIADANCTKACLYLSVVLLVASLGYEVTRVGGFDAIGAAVIGVLSFREGREAFQKAKGKACGCGGVCASEQDEQ